MHSGGGLTLAGVRRLGILLTWPEAVAVVLEASEQVQRAGGTLVTPDLEHVSIGPDGMLKVLPGSPIPSHPVRQVARMLGELTLHARAPAELRELVAQNDRARPACAWIEEFTTALAYFARPHRAQILADLANRVMARQATMAPGAAPPARTDSDSDSSPRFSGTIGRLFRRLFRS